MTSPRVARTFLVMIRAWCVLCAIATLGCSSFIERRAASSTHRILLESSVVARRLPDLELARAAMPGGIVQLESFARAYPAHRGFKVLHADALCQYVVAFVFDDWEDAKLGGREDEATRLAGRIGPLLEMCVEANLRLLAPAWRAARTEGPKAMTARLPSATRADVPALLWIATADSVQLAIDPMRHFTKLPALQAMLGRCAALAPGYRDADAELLLGTLIAAQSQVLGGDDADAEFAVARSRAGEGALIVDVMFARGTAIARKDRALFEATLERVLATDVTRWPERRLANELARRKARRYLAASTTLLP